MRYGEAELDSPTAVEMPPIGNARRNELIEFNRQMTAGSGGRLPDYENDGDTIQIVSATCGHTSQTFRCMHYGSPSDFAKLSKDGFLSMDLLRMAQPQYAGAVVKGSFADTVQGKIVAPRA